MCTRSYRDERNRDQKGYFISLGTCHELESKEQSEKYRRDAIGNNGKPLAVSHNAAGTLNRVVVQLGC